MRQQLPHRRLAQIAGDEDDAGATIVVGPGRQGHRRMEEMLHAVQNQRRVAVPGIDDALDPQQILALQRNQNLDGQGQLRPGDRLVEADDEGLLTPVLRVC